MLSNLRLKLQTLAQFILRPYREMTERYRNLIDLSPDMVLVHQHQKIVYINQAGLNLLGAKSSAELIGRAVLDLVHPDYRASVKARLQLAQEQPKVTPTAPREITFVRLDGQPVILEILSQTISYQGQLGWQVIGRDITVRKQTEADLRRVQAEREQAQEALKHSEAKLRAILEASPQAFALIDNSGLLQAFNKNFSEQTKNLLGVKVKSGDDFSSIIPMSLRDTCLLHFEWALKGKRIALEQELSSAEGVKQWFEVVYSPVLHQNGEVEGVCLSRTDITRRKQVEKALQNSELRLSKIFQAAPMPVILTRLEDGRCLEINTNFTRLTGVTPEEAIGRTSLEILRLDATARQRIIEQVRQHGAVQNFETKIYNKQGDLRWVLASTQEVEINGEKCNLSTFYDITERKRLEEALHDSEERYRSVVNAMIEGIVIQDGQGAILTCNASAERILGLTFDQMAGRTSIDPRWQAIHEDGSPFPGQEHPAMITLRTGQPCLETVMGVHKPDGTLSWLSVNSQPLFRPAETSPYGVVASFADITARKQAEQALRQSEKLYRTLVHNLPDAGVMLYDQELRFTIVEGSALEQAGYNKQEMEGKTLREVVPPVSAQELEPYYRRALGGTTSLFEREKNGRVYHSRILPVRNEQNEIFAGMVMVQDITELKQAEILIAAEKERLAVTLRSIGDGVITTDTAGRVTLLNSVAEALTGWEQREAQGKPVEEIFRIVHEQTRQPAENPIYKTLKSGQILELANHTALLARDGLERSIADSSAPIRNNNNQIVGAVLVFRDVTEQHKIAEELSKASKLEALGVLAGGIAHDFNNLLTSIMGNISLAKIDQNLTEDVLELLDNAEKAALRSKDLTQQLLTFAKGGAPVKEVTHLSQVIQDAARFALHGAKVQCVFDFPSELWAVKMDSGQISQVIQNLVLNAVQAMPKGGTIYISKENLWLPTPEIGSLAAGKYLKVSIRDEGSGIKPEDLPKIFDPYFTTKAQGSGLGLAVCYSIIKNHDGHIEVHSEVGKGTTFCIYLPALTSYSSKISQIDSGLVVGQGRILVMDDQIMLRLLAIKALQKLGYQVQVAKDGQEVVELYRQAQLNNQPFDGVMLDLTVPGGMGGQQAMAELLVIDPQVKAIVCSGYSNDPVMANYREYGFRGVLPKPYTFNNLSKALQQLLSK